MTKYSRTDRNEYSPRRTDSWRHPQNYVAIGSLVTMIIVSITAFVTMSELTFDNQNQKITTINHANPEHSYYKDEHMSYQKKLEVFYTRKEGERLETEVQNAIDAMNKLTLLLARKYNLTIEETPKTPSQ
jgi:hypothetical protein